MKRKTKPMITAVAESIGSTLGAVTRVASDFIEAGFGKKAVASLPAVASRKKALKKKAVKKKSSAKKKKAAKRNSKSK